MNLAKFLITSAVLSIPASAATLQFDESVSGDLGGPAAPTSVTLGVGTNTVVGVTGGPGGATDRDAFTFTIGTGQSLVSIFLDTYNTVGSTASNTGFYAIDEGSTTIVPNSSNSGQLLTGRTFNFQTFNPPAGQVDLLETTNLTAGPGISGGELGPGTYTFLIQNTSTLSDFGLSLNVVPEPSSVLLLALGALGLGRRRR